MEGICGCSPSLQDLEEDSKITCAEARFIIGENDNATSQMLKIGSIAV